jgi:uncharacterized protein
LSKGSDRSPRPGGRGKSRAGRRSHRRPTADSPPPAPNLAWAKWIDAIGGEDLESAGPESPHESPLEVEERLRLATEAAERARLARDAAATSAPTADNAAPEARKTRRPRTVMIPPRHDPETLPGPLAMSEPPIPRRTRVIAESPQPDEPAETPAISARFEFDVPSSPNPGRPLEREPLAIPPPSAPPAADRLWDEPLPHRYHDDRITLIARDPYWLHAYWEVTAANYARAQALLGDALPATLVLRVYHYPAPHDPASGQMDIELHADARNWYVHGGRPGHGFEVEIGLRGPGDRFVPLSRSNRATTPLDRMSEVRDEKWLSLAGEDEQMYALSGGYATMGPASAEMPELVARRIAEMMGSETVSSFGLASGSAAPPRAPRPRGFWFVLGTELIVYGATDPGATVLCQGRPVALRRDGTFTLRFALPDGSQVIDCRAISSDRLDSITITPAVSKTTRRDEHHDPAGNP